MPIKREQRNKLKCQKNQVDFLFAEKGVARNKSASSDLFLMSVSEVPDFAAQACAVIFQPLLADRTK